MRLTLFLSAFSMILLLSCAKEEVIVNSATNVTLEDRGPKPKIDVCHYDEDENTWVLINVNLNAWPAHEGHGDVRLDDQDGDGYYPDNECGVGPMGDCDDLDASIYPGAEEICGDGIDQDCDGQDESCLDCPCFTLGEILENDNFAYFDTQGGSNCRVDGTGFEEPGCTYGVAYQRFFCVGPNGCENITITAQEKADCIAIVEQARAILNLPEICNEYIGTNNTNQATTNSSPFKLEAN